MKKTINVGGAFSKLTGKGVVDYTCRYDWPDNCFVQGGGNGIVLTTGTMQQTLSNPEEAVKCLTGQTPHYMTAFFEAFPKEPSTFIRGEGKTVEEAEDSAWKQFQKITACTKHEFEAKGYTNGCGFCKHCGLFGIDVLPITEKCVVCGVPTYCKSDKNGKFYCKTCPIPQDLKLQWMLDVEQREEERKQRVANGTATKFDLIQEEVEKQLAENPEKD